MNKFICFFSFVVLSACSSSSQVNPDPMLSFAGRTLGLNPSPIATYTPSPTYPISDDYGKTFRVFAADLIRSFLNSGIDSSVPDYGTNNIEIVDASTIRFKKADGSYAVWTEPKLFGIGPNGSQRISYSFVDRYDENGDPVFSGEELLVLWGGDNYPVRQAYTSTGQSGTSIPGTTQTQFFFGPATDVAALSNASASYKMLYSNVIASTPNIPNLGIVPNQSGAGLRLAGEGLLNVDFTTANITGSIFDNTSKNQELDLVLTVNDARLIGADFVGSLEVNVSNPNDPFFAVADVETAEFAGQITGAKGEAVIGAFGGSFATNSTSGQDAWNMSGSFVGCDPDCALLNGN